MDWSAKFDVIVTSLESDDRVADDFFVKECGANEGFIKELKNDYPFIPDAYISFLERTDGATIAQCRFLGSSNFGVFAPLHCNAYPEKDWLLIGLDPGGAPLLLRSTQEIVIGEGKSCSGKFDVLANSFDEFLCDVMMGQRFASVFRVRDLEQFYKDEIDQDTWIEYLAKQGWIKIT